MRWRRASPVPGSRATHDWTRSAGKGRRQCSHREPGGLSVRQLLSIVQSIDVPIVGADVVELNPRQDPTGASAMVAAKILRELVGVMKGKG